MIRVDPPRRREKVAIQLVKHYGGLCSVTNNNYIGVSDSFFEHTEKRIEKKGTYEPY